MKKILVLAMVLVFSTAFADEFEIQSAMTQSQFKDLTKEVALFVTPTPNNPAEPLKTFGFDIALESTITDINNDDTFWENAWDSGDADGMVMVNRVHFQKGFPFGLDLGVSLSKGANIPFTAITGEVKYALLKGTVATPAFSVKAAYTKVFGLNDVDIQTLLAGAYISKGILFLTPYAGVETIASFAKDESDYDLDNETSNTVRALAGLQISPLPLISINLEAAGTGTVMQYGLKAGLRF